MEEATRPTVPSMKANNIYRVDTTQACWRGPAVTVCHALVLARLAGVRGHVNNVAVHHERVPSFRSYVASPQQKKVEMNWKKLWCFLVGHRRVLHAGRYVGFPNESASTWITCRRCGRLLSGPSRGPEPWTTVCDLDFTVQPSQTLSDGPDATVQIVNGTGLVVTPKSET